MWMEKGEGEVVAHAGRGKGTELWGLGGGYDQGPGRLTGTEETWRASAAAAARTVDKGQCSKPWAPPE